MRTRLHDKPIKLTLGDVHRIDLGKARSLAEEALRAARRGDDPRLARTVAQANTVAAVVEEFIQRYAKPQLKVWGEVDRRLKPAWYASTAPVPLPSLPAPTLCVCSTSSRHAA